jgi:PhzF family phenazine biosynthesis protein
MPRQPFTQVDAFTEHPFAGNPAAVCLLPQPKDERWMQQVAQEMNLADTAFLVRRTDGFDLRWFTPSVEVDLCGHATLASAHVLWEEAVVPADTAARFHTRSGLLTASRSDGRIWLDFPALTTGPEPATPELAEALGAPPVGVWRTPFDLLVELASEEAVRTLAPDLARLAQVPVRGVIVTAPSAAPGTDFVSRFFAPRIGIPEDPVTGSAHCALGPFWGDRLGRRELLARQLSPRGGTVWLALAGDRVRLGGHAVTVARGELFC